MSKNVADVLWEMLAKAGVKRCYGIVGDALNPVVVCGTAGPGVVHLFNGLMDARKEGAPIIAIAGDVETSILDTSSLEELNPYKFFEAASLYTARLVNPAQ